ncbi:hypothetical protein [Lysinibacillus capsici]
MKKYLKNVLWFLFFVSVATIAYINMDYGNVAPQDEQQEIKHVQM